MFSDTYFWLTAIAAIAMLSIGLVSFIRDSKTSVNRTFILMVLAVVGWIISNYLSNSGEIGYDGALYANYALFGFSYSVGLLLVRFVILYTEDKKFHQIYRHLQLVLWLIVPLFASPLVTKGIYREGSVYNIEFGPLIGVYAILLMSSMGFSMYILRRNRRHVGRYEKKRIATMFVIIATCAPLIILTQFLLPATTGWFGLTNLGVLPIFGVVFGLYYGIAKHRLFNVTPSFTRSLVYVLTVSLLTFIYLLLSTAVSMIVAVQQSWLIHLLVNGTLILTLLVGYQPLLKLFRRITDKVFLQDMYDPKDIYDRLNAKLVSTIDLRKMLRDTAIFLSEAMKLEYMVFVLHSKDAGYREFGSKKYAGSRELQRYFTTHPVLKRQPVIITEDISKTDQQLLTVLEKEDVAVVIRMDLKHISYAESMNFVIVGPKRNGYSYSSEDRRTLETIVKELALAVQNALQYEEIRQFNITLQQKVDDATSKLKASNDRLKKLDETKDDFMSMASHQLRTPLTSIKGYISMLMEGDMGKVTPMQRKALEEAYNSSQRMVYLIGDFLNLSRLRTGKFELEISEVSLPRIIQEEIAQLRATAESRGVRLIYDAPVTFPTICVDETKLRQVMMNFIDNAVYYSKPSGGRIMIVLEHDQESVSFRVVDNGIGVEKAQQKHLFTKFYRTPSARKARPDGTGIGLYMARKVIDAHGGTVIFESQENIGSTFGFRLPIVAAIDTQNTPQ